MAGERVRTDVEVRRLTVDDDGGLLRLFSSLDELDRSFFRDDVTDPAVVAALVNDDHGERIVVVVDNTIVGYAAVINGWGWSRHVGELRIATSPEYRQRGIGRLLAQRAVIGARDAGLEKLVVDVVAGQDRLFEMFTGLGFRQEGVLRCHVRSAAGETRDLLVLSHFVDDLAAELAD